MREYFEGDAHQTRRSMVNNTCFGVNQWRGLRFTDEQCRIRRWPLPNVWLGVTAERQQEADERIPELLATPATARFVSIEPQLGPIDLTRIPDRLDESGKLKRAGIRINALTGRSCESGMPYHSDWNGVGALPTTPAPRLDQVICGGESGPSARPMHPDWARSLRDQCAATGVPYFFKQWGEWEPREEWAPAERVCQMAIFRDGSGVSDDIAPQDVGGHRMARVGKRRAGRLLDGREHSEFPA